MLLLRPQEFRGELCSDLIQYNPTNKKPPTHEGNMKGKKNHIRYMKGKNLIFS